jgi:hypothetical protein
MSVLQLPDIIRARLCEIPTWWPPSADVQTGASRRTAASNTDMHVSHRQCCRVALHVYMQHIDSSSDKRFYQQLWLATPLPNAISPVFSCSWLPAIYLLPLLLLRSCLRCLRISTSRLRLWPARICSTSATASPSLLPLAIRAKIASQITLRRQN